MDNIFTIIKQRRSVRKYTEESISAEALFSILEAGRWAPSGLNNQPWRFVIVREPSCRGALAKLTKYSKIIDGSALCIAVYFHIPSGYNRDKDLMGMGACIQNMLLAAHAEGIGTVWLGEILNRKQDVNELLGVDADHELMAVIACGIPDEHPHSSRKDLSSLILKEI